MKYLNRQMMIESSESFIENGKVLVDFLKLDNMVFYYEFINFSIIWDYVKDSGSS